MAGVLKKLGYDKVDVLGHSMVAASHSNSHSNPEMVRRPGAGFHPLRSDGFYPEMAAAAGGNEAAAMAEQIKETPIYSLTWDCATPGRVSEAPTDGRIYAQTVRLVCRRQKLDHAGMLIYGDSDMFRPSMR